jgi:hypothetical protein
MLSYLYHIFLIKSITLWNICTSYYTSLQQTLSRTYNDAKHYLNNHHAIWFFLPGHTLPLPRYCISNLSTSFWKYDTTTKQLSCDIKDPISYSFSWLSVTLVITHQGTHEYDMDPFLESFRVHTDIYHPPTLHMLFMAWCAQHSLWFPKNSVITMRVIDHLGNDMILNLLDHNDSITIHSGKLHTSISSGILPYETYPMIRPTPSIHKN